MAEPEYPHGDALVPAARDEHTVVLLVRPQEPPDLAEEELDRLQIEHLTYLRDLTRRGLLVANGPLTEQTDRRLRGISIYAVPLEDALRLASADPMVRAGWLAVEAGRWSTARGHVGFDAGRMIAGERRPTGQISRGRRRSGRGSRS